MPDHISTEPATSRPFLGLCLVAPSGSGKSTTAQLIRHWLITRGHSVEVVKLAEPLYRIQAMFYAEAGIALTPETQDQELLESVATQLRAIHARALSDGFLRRLAASRADVVINDDLRDDRIDWPALRAAGFRVIKVAARAEVRAQRLAERNDLSVVKDSPLDLQMARIEADYVLTNNGSLAALEAQVDGLCRLLVGERAEAAA
ncbi:hypothetical protein J7E49_24740 [Variovorax paradoxus]|nr:hypothetical protein [Variovorax paradoxus]